MFVVYFSPCWYIKLKGNTCRNKKWIDIWHYCSYLLNHKQRVTIPSIPQCMLPWLGITPTISEEQFIVSLTIIIPIPTPLHYIKNLDATWLIRFILECLNGPQGLTNKNKNSLEKLSQKIRCSMLQLHHVTRPFYYTLYVFWDFGSMGHPVKSCGLNPEWDTMQIPIPSSRRSICALLSSSFLKFLHSPGMLFSLHPMIAVICTGFWSQKAGSSWIKHKSCPSSLCFNMQKGYTIG